MSARNSDDGRVAELYRVIQETRERIERLHLTREVFVGDETVQGRMNADGLFMCVFRIAEEAGHMSAETQKRYPQIPWRAIRGMRNMFAHDYGKLDRMIVWNAIQDDFPVLEAFCRSYAQDAGMELSAKI